MNTIAVDAMGSDAAPIPEVGGALEALRTSSSLKVLLVGDEEQIRAELERQDASGSDRIEVVPASDVVLSSDSPASVYRTKPNSSLRIAFDSVSSGRAKAVVSAGNSGATFAHALFSLGRLPGIERPGIVTVFPKPRGTMTLCDVGANVEAKATVLAQFGVLAAHYDRLVHGRACPRVGLLSNGEEASKGTSTTREADVLLRSAADATTDFDYVGYVEGSDLFGDRVDVVATDGFTGNILLKASEALSEALLEMVSETLEHSLRTKVGAALIRPALADLREHLHYSQSGGALLSGVKGVVVICHGRSDRGAMCNAIVSSGKYVDSKLVEGLEAAVASHHEQWKNAKSTADGDSE
jgi:glycerol-3-phosphate acyltransferase PlsX